MIHGISIITPDFLDGFPSKLLVEIQRTSDALTTTLQNVGINHGRSHIVVSQEFQDSSDVITALLELRNKGMPKRLACGVFGKPVPYIGLAISYLQIFLNKYKVLSLLISSKAL
jgi:hypothetical protein